MLPSQPASYLGTWAVRTFQVQKCIWPLCKLLYVHFLQADVLGPFLGTPQWFGMREEIWLETLSSQVEMPFCDNGARKGTVIWTTQALAELVLRVCIALQWGVWFLHQLLSLLWPKPLPLWFLGQKQELFSRRYFACLLCLLSENSLEIYCIWTDAWIRTPKMQLTFSRWLNNKADLIFFAHI